MKTSNALLYLDANNKIRIYFTKKSVLDFKNNEFLLSHKDPGLEQELDGDWNWTESVKRKNVIYQIFFVPTEFGHNIYLIRENKTSMIASYFDINKETKFAPIWWLINPLFLGRFYKYVKDDTKELDVFDSFHNYDCFIVMETINQLLPYDFSLFPLYAPVDINHLDNKSELYIFWEIFLKTFNFTLKEFQNAVYSNFPNETFKEYFLKKEQQFVDIDQSCSYLSKILWVSKTLYGDEFYIKIFAGR
jgi:hypothetical protein